MTTPSTSFLTPARALCAVLLLDVFCAATLLALLAEAPLRNWACAIGLATAALALCGGAVVARLRRRAPLVLYLPTDDQLTRLLRSAEGLTLQDVARLVWPRLPWREAIRPWAISPSDPEQPALVERLEPAVWLLRRLTELAQAGEVPYVPSAYAGRRLKERC